MNDIEQLHQIVQTAIPEAVIEYSPAIRPTAYQLHLKVDGRWFHVFWDDTGFWIGRIDLDDPNVGLFDIMAPDAVNVQTVDDAAKLLLGLIASPAPVAAAR